MTTKTKKPRHQKRRPTGAPIGPRAIIERMQSAGVEFRWLPGGGLFVRGLSLCAPDLRAAFLDGDGGELHRAARVLSPSSGGI